MATRPTNYEFDKLENQAFVRLAAAMRFASLLLALGAAATVVLGLGAALESVSRGAWLALVFALAGTLVPLLCALWTLRASTHFRLIADTEGNDIVHLMDAVAHLTKLYLLQLTLFLVAFGGIVAIAIMTARG